MLKPTILLSLAAVAAGAVPGPSASPTAVDLGPTTLVPPTRPQASATAPTPLLSSLEQDAIDPLDASPPVVTPAPQDGYLDRVDNVRFRITTYTSCVTLGTYVHCGVHEPILDAAGNCLGRQCASGTAARAALIAGVLAVVLARI